MYRSVFTVGVAVTNALQNSALTFDNALTDYSYINSRDGDPNGAPLAHCLTGLGPTSISNNANGALGGLYFNGNMIPNGDETAPCASDVIQVRPGSSAAGVINFYQCATFTTANEGVYTCTMMNSSMMDQSVRFGLYFTGRSKSFDFCIPSLNHLSSFYIAAPVLDTPSSSTITVAVGSSLTLSCTSRGSPPDTFTWRKDNSATILQSTSITAVDYTSTSAVFRADYSINNINTSDSGTYTCTITNPIGSDSTTITVVSNYLCKLLIYIYVIAG